MHMQSTTHQERDRLYHQAVTCHQNGDIQNAIRLYQSILQDGYDLPVVHCNLGMALSATDKQMEAVGHFEKALALMPSFPEAFFNLGNACNRLNHIPRAIESYHNALSLRQPYPEAQNNIRFTFLHLQDIETAAACRRQMVAANIPFPESWFHLGNTFDRLGQPENAINCFEEAVRLRFDYADAINNLGLALHASGRSAEAINVLKSLVMKQPDYAIGHNNLETVLREAAESSGVLACYRDVITLNPGDTESRFYLGNALIKNKKYSEAESVISKIHHYDPDFGATRLSKIRIETASACNLRCGHCPTGSGYGRMKRGLMDMRIFEQLLDQIKHISTIRQGILYLSGEPLLNPHLPEMCRRLRTDTQIQHIQFNTNAMLITEDICRQLADAGVDHIGVSVDGASPEENNRIRRGSDYYTIVDNVAMMRRHLKTTRISIDNTRIKRAGDPDQPAPPPFLLRDFPGLAVESVYAMKWPGLDMQKGYLQSTAISTLPAAQFCQMPFTQLAVRMDGTVSFCCYDLIGASRVGNISSQHIETIWNSRMYKNLRRHMLNYERDALPDICRQCILYTGEILVSNDTISH